MEKVDKGCLMTRMGVSGWMFLLVPAHPGSPGKRAIKQLCACYFPTSSVTLCYYYYCDYQYCCYYLLYKKPCKCNRITTRRQVHHHTPYHVNWDRCRECTEADRNATRHRRQAHRSSCCWSWLYQFPVKHYTYWAISELIISRTACFCNT